MDDQKLVETANSGRLIALAEHEIYPLLDKRITERIQLMRSKFSGGEKDFLADMAYIAALMDLKNHLLGLQDKARQAFKKLEEKQNEQQ